MILEDFGDAELAKNCTSAIVAAAAGVPTEFSVEALTEAAAIDKAGIHEKEKAQRLALRDRIIFTIDSADTKDIDDAVSLTQHGGTGWELGVHIADVSYYVHRLRAPSTSDAYARGTSVYYAELGSFPCCPRRLSNGICSLNEGEDRLAFSCHHAARPARATLTSATDFQKTLIRSERSRASTCEINALLAGDGLGTEIHGRSTEQVLAPTHAAYDGAVRQAAPANRERERGGTGAGHPASPRSFWIENRDG